MKQWCVISPIGLRNGWIELRLDPFHLESDYNATLASLVGLALSVAIFKNFNQIQIKAKQVVIKNRISEVSDVRFAYTDLFICEYTIYKWPFQSERRKSLKYSFNFYQTAEDFILLSIQSFIILSQFEDGLWLKINQTKTKMNCSKVYFRKQ